MVRGGRARTRRCRSSRRTRIGIAERRGKVSKSGRGLLRIELYLQRRPARRHSSCARRTGRQSGFRHLFADGTGPASLRHERTAIHSARTGRVAMLTMLEEVVLLAVDEKSGGVRSTREFATAYALVGAVFFDLALARKIDTDTESIRIIETTPTGNSTLDRILADMTKRPDLKTVKKWIEEI